MELIESRVEGRSRKPRALGLAANAAFEAKEYQKAIDYWQRLLKQVPPNSEVSANRSRRVSTKRKHAAVGSTNQNNEQRKLTLRNHRNTVGFHRRLHVCQFDESKGWRKRKPLQRRKTYLPIIRRSAGAQAPMDPAAMREQVTAQIEKARTEPKNFEAQIKAAELYYQIQRYDQAIEFLLKANQLKPTDYETVVVLGLVNLDAGHYDQAEKWYRAALKMKQDDVRCWREWRRRR